LFVTFSNQEGSKKLVDEALMHLDSATKLKPDLVEAYALVRRCLFWRAFLDPATAMTARSESQAALEKAKALAPENPLVMIEEAFDLLYKPAQAGGNQEQGLARFREAIKRLGQHPGKDPACEDWWLATAHMMLGQTYLAMAKPEQAEEAFKVALVIEPDFEVVKNAMLPMTQLAAPPAIRRFDNVAWTTLATDSAGDGKSQAWPDVKALLLYDDVNTDTLWFKFELSRLPNPQAFGINLMVDADQDQRNGVNWWGGNSSFKYDKLVSVWVIKAGENSYRGTVGIADARAVQLNRYTNLFQNNLAFSADAGSKTMLLGVKRGDIDGDGNFNMIAAVGSNAAWNDDITDTGSIEIRLRK
jgi:hypothetical protein